MLVKVVRISEIPARHGRRNKRQMQREMHVRMERNIYRDLWQTDRH